MLVSSTRYPALRELREGRTPSKAPATEQKLDAKGGRYVVAAADASVLLPICLRRLQTATATVKPSAEISVAESEPLAAVVFTPEIAAARTARRQLAPTPGVWRMIHLVYLSIGELRAEVS